VKAPVVRRTSVGLAAACHQGFSANLYTADFRFSFRLVRWARWWASAVWLGASGIVYRYRCGPRASMDWELQGAFPDAGSAYLLALAIIHALVPAWSRQNQCRNANVSSGTFRLFVRMYGNNLIGMGGRGERMV